MQTATATPDFYAVAELEIEQRALNARQALSAARDDIARFQALCEVLREHGLKFSHSVSSYYGAVTYWILMYPHLGDQAGEMLLTLAALDCNESEDKSEGCDTHLKITGPHAPEFNLKIYRTHPAARKQTGESCHAA